MYVYINICYIIARKNLASWQLVAVVNVQSDATHVKLPPKPAQNEKFTYMASIVLWLPSFFISFHFCSSRAAAS